MARPDISIIIPAYNVQEYICEALDSVLVQSDNDNEIIIVNDGSTDSTAQRIAEYQNNNILKVYHTENRGLGPARNYGLERASGRYVYFFDSDDILSKNFMNEIREIIYLNNSPDIIFFSGESFANDGFKGAFAPNYERKLDGLFRKKDFPISEMQRKKCFFGSACLYVSKKRIWIDNELKFKNIIHEDEDMLFPLSTLADTIYVSSKKLFYRRLRPGSIIHSGQAAEKIESYKIVIESLAYLFRTSRNRRYFDLRAFRRRMRFFVLRYSILSRETGSHVDLRFLLKKMFQVGDCSLILVWLFGKMPGSMRERIISQR